MTDINDIWDDEEDRQSFIARDITPSRRSSVSEAAPSSSPAPADLTETLVSAIMKAHDDSGLVDPEWVDARKCAEAIAAGIAHCISAARAVAPAGVPEYAEVYVGGGKFAICDWEDWPIVRQYNWRLTTKNKSGCLYAQAWDGEDAKTRRRVSMHGLIIPSASLVDHKDGNGLNNRRSNLRPATKQQNAFNSTSNRGASKYKGVSLDKGSGLWRAYITVNGERKYLGRHGSQEDAAKAYDMAAKKYFGEFARTNHDH